MATFIGHWLQQREKVRRVVCWGSCVVGLLCAALSSSFKYLLEKWILWKILVYILFGLALVLFVLWSTVSSNDSIYPETEVGRIILVLVLVITSVYTYFMDEKVEVKPDAYILVSNSAFAIMSVFLSSLSHCGFENELLYFFTCTVIIQLMKIKWWLFTVGGIFMYFLVSQGPTLNPTSGDPNPAAGNEDEAGLLTAGASSSQGASGNEEGNSGLVSLRGSRELGDPNPAAGNMDNSSQELNVHSRNEDEVGLLTAGASSSQGASGNEEGNSGLVSLRGSRELGDPNPAAGNMDNSSQELNVHSRNEDEVGLLTAGASSSQGASGNEEGNSGNVPAAFSVCIEALKKENDSVIDKVYQHALDNNVRADANLVDKNLVVDSLQLKDLHKSAQLMIKEGSKEKCLQEYTSWRREFLKIILLLFPSPPDLEVEDIQKEEKIQGWLETLTVAVRILFPNEMTLCRRVFGSHNLSDFALVEVCGELAIQLIATSYAVATWSHFTPNTLGQLLQELDTMFQFIPGELSSFITDQVYQVRIILANFEQLKSDFTNDYSANVIDANGIHSITRQVMNYIGDEFKKSDDSFLGRCFEKYATAAKQGKLSPSALVETMINMLENSLEASSKSYKTSSGCVYIMINRTFIAREIERLGLKPIIGYDWLQRNQDKIEQNLQLYVSSSWDDTLNLFMVDYDDYRETSEYYMSTMEDNVSSFKQRFELICDVEENSIRFVLDDNLRVQIIKSIKKKLLPAYENFKNCYKGLYHSDYYEDNIHPLLHGVEDRLDNLFLERAGESDDDAPKEEKKNV